MKTGLFNRSGSLRLFIGAGMIAVLASCASERPFDPSGLSVNVDSAVYHLQPQQGHTWYQINLTFTIVNNKDYAVFLGQYCGSWSIDRADEADKTPLYLGEYGCALTGGPGSPQPITLAPGEKFSRTFRVTGSNSPDTRPPITIENNTGTLVFSWGLTDDFGTPVGVARSAPFRVEPPAA